MASQQKHGLLHSLDAFMTMLDPEIQAANEQQLVAVFGAVAAT